MTPDEEIVQLDSIVDALHARIAELEAQVEAAGMRWPQSVATLEKALSTFPAGRIWLAAWDKSDRERDAAQWQAFAMAWECIGRLKNMEREHDLRCMERDEAQANVTRIVWLYRPFIDTGKRETIDGRQWARCMCGWLEKLGETRCRNEAHQGNVQRAYEDQIERTSREKDTALARAATLETALEAMTAQSLEQSQRAATAFGMTSALSARAAAAERVIAQVTEEVEDMETQVAVDEGHGGVCNDCAAGALKRAADGLRLALAAVPAPAPEVPT